MMFSKMTFQVLKKLTLTISLLICLTISGYSQTKMQKDGKYKAKGHHAREHYHHAESRKKHHKAEFGQHSRMENQGFSKKKNKRKNKT